MAQDPLRDLDARLEAFAADLERAAGDNLRSLVLYGSAARGNVGPGSDVNLLLLLQDASAAALRPLSPAIRQWVKSGEPPPLIFSETSWHASADVFPIEIEDVRRHHKILRGADPVADIPTARDDLRRELEREARGKLIQLSAHYAAAAPDGKALSSLIAASCKAFLVLFRAGLRLANREAPVANDAVARDTAALCGFPSDALAWPLARLAGGKTPDLAPYDPIAADFLDAVTAFVNAVDRA
jgi:predicted nucleotidyltransferase